jgi:hypothetical protein
MVEPDYNEEGNEIWNKDEDGNIIEKEHLWKYYHCNTDCSIKKHIKINKFKKREIPKITYEELIGKITYEELIEKMERLNILGVDISAKVECGHSEEIRQPYFKRFFPDKPFDKNRSIWQEFWNTVDYFVLYDPDPMSKQYKERKAFFKDLIRRDDNIIP